MEQKDNKIMIELPGFRNIKTVLAVLLCLVLYEFLGRDAFLYYRNYLQIAKTSYCFM